MTKTINVTKDFISAKNKKGREEILNFTEPYIFIINNNKYRDIKWFDIRTITIITIYNKGYKDLIDKFPGIKKGEYEGTGWKYYKDPNISIHRYGSAETCYQVIKQAKEYNFNLKIEFFWNEKGLNPSEKGLIEIKI